MYDEGRCVVKGDGWWKGDETYIYTHGEGRSCLVWVGEVERRRGTD